MEEYILSQLLRRLAHAGQTTKSRELTAEEQFLLSCYGELDDRDKKDLLCFLFEKISH